MQAQDAVGIRWALSLRASERPDDEAVIDSLDHGLLVRNRPSRGTLQVTAPEDMHWLTDLLSIRSNRAAEQRRGQLDLDERMLTAAGEVVRAELADGAVRTRPELVAACAAEGIELDGSQAGHVLRHLTQTMAIVFAHAGGRSDAFASAEGWIHERRTLDRQEALGEVARRFVSARGPVTRADLARWADLSMGDVDAGLEAAGTLESVHLARTDWLVGRGTADISDAEVDAALRKPLLLPAFDEYLLGYGTRAPIIEDAHQDRVVPGRNGMFKPIVVVNGEIVGTWRRAATTKRVTVVVEPFTRLTTRARAALAAPVRAYGAFLGREAALRSP